MLVGISGWGLGSSSWLLRASGRILVLSCRLGGRHSGLDFVFRLLVRATSDWLLDVSSSSSGLLVLVTCGAIGCLCLDDWLHPTTIFLHVTWPGCFTDLFNELGVELVITQGQTLTFFSCLRTFLTSWTEGNE